MSAKILWLTGLSGSGKSTLAKLLSSYFLRKKSKTKVKLIDGDKFRKINKNKNSFSKKNIFINNLSIIRHAESIKTRYDYIVVSVISPLAKTRLIARKKFKKKYFEIYLKSKVSSLRKRDPKGLYKNKNYKMIGVNSPIKYEQSNYKKIIINTDKLTKQESIKKIMRQIN